jgi:hypothetical protein
MTISEKKEQLMAIFRQKLSDPYKQYKPYEPHLKLGVMTRTFYKNGHHYVRKGDVVLYHTLHQKSEVPLSVFAAADGTMLGCRTHWVVSLEEAV